MKRLVINLATAGMLAVLAAASINAQPVRPAQPRPTDAHVHVNINTATAEQLQFLPHVGKVLAGRIAEYRALHGQFRVASDLRQIKGFGDKSVARVAPFAVVSGPTTASAKIKAGAK